MLLSHAVQSPGVVDDILQIASGKLAVMMRLVIFLHIEVHAALTDVGITVIQDFLYQFYLLDDMPGGMRFDAGRQHIQGLHGRMETVRVVLCHLHRLQLLQTSLLGNFIFAFVGIVLQMPHIRNITHIAYLITDMLQVTEQQVERNGRTGMSQMGIPIYCRPADIHPDTTRRDGFELFLFTGKRIIDK